MTADTTPDGADERETCSNMAMRFDFGGNAEPCALHAGHDGMHTSADGRKRWLATPPATEPAIVTQLRAELAAATARAETAEAALLTERKHTDEAIAEARELRAALETLRGQIGEPETEWGHQNHGPDGYVGDGVGQASQAAARSAVEYLNTRQLPPHLRAVLVVHEVWHAETEWRVAEEGGEAT